MDRKNIGLCFNLKFEEIQTLNPSFDLAKIRIAYSGINRNRCVISKEVFERAIPTLYNIPLVGRYIPEEKDFGSHDVIVVKNDDGKYSVENATTPFGVIPESAEIGWETVKEENGEEREYLYTDCLIWKRSFGYETLISQDNWNQSMEITVTDYDIDINDYMIVNDMVFTALCILGNSNEPCFESACVQISKDNAENSFKKQFALMINDMKDFASTEFSLSRDKGGEFGLNFSTEMRDAILAEAGLTIDDIDFEITETMTEEEFRNKLFNNQDNDNNTDDDDKDERDTDNNDEDDSDDDKNDDNDNVDVDNSIDDNDESVPACFAATYMEKRDAIAKALKTIVNKNADGDVISETYFWLCDFDDKYVYVESRTWSCESEDAIFAYGRRPYVYSDSTKDVTVGDFEEMIVKWITLAENAKIDAAREELVELRQFKLDKLAAEHKVNVDTFIAENFAKVSKTKDFSELGDKIYEFTREELEEKLYAIKGRQEIVEAGRSSSSASIKIPVGSSENKKSNKYGDLFERYAKNN